MRKGVFCGRFIINWFVFCPAGRILESLAARGVGLYPALGLPPVHQLPGQHDKPTSVSSASPQSSPPYSAPSSPTQKVRFWSEQNTNTNYATARQTINVYLQNARFNR